MQSGRNWLGFGDSPQAGPSVWDMASQWGKGKAAEKAASMAMTAIGGPSAGIAAEAGKDLLPQLFASLFNKGGDVQYKDEGGDITSQLSIPREVKLQMLLDQYKNMYESAGLSTDPSTNMRSAMQEKAGSMPSARKRGRTTWSDVWGALGNPLRGSDLLPAYLLGQLPAFKNQMIVTDSERNQGIPFGGPLSEVKYKKTGGDVSDEVTLKMAPLSRGE